MSVVVVVGAVGGGLIVAAAVGLDGAANGGAIGGPVFVRRSIPALHFGQGRLDDGKCSMCSLCVVRVSLARGVT